MSRTTYLNNELKAAIEAAGKASSNTEREIYLDLASFCKRSLEDAEYVVVEDGVTFRRDRCAPIRKVRRSPIEVFRLTAQSFPEIGFGACGVNNRRP